MKTTPTTGGDTPTPSQAPLSAGAVPELPVVGWTIPNFALYVCDAVKRLGQAPGCEVPLTPHAPAQATIDALRADLKEVCELGLWRKSEMERLTKELAALKAKQVAEVDEVMRLADAMGRHYADWVTSGLGRTLMLHNAAREALLAALTKDRT